MDIKWIEPPAKRQGYTDNKAIYAALKANPGVWALYRESTYASYGYAFVRKYPGVELTTRKVGKNDNGTYLYDMYVRYVGETDNA